MSRRPAIVEYPVVPHKLSGIKSEIVYKANFSAFLTSLNSESLAKYLLPASKDPYEGVFFERSPY